MKAVIVIICFVFTSCLYAQQPVVHDPVVIKEKNTYYLFCTGNGINMFSSTDLKNWKQEKSVFSKPPAWAVSAVPAFKGHIWAPDIVYYNGLYYLYYSISAFGKNTSCIGVATNTTLDPSSKNYKWVDHGKVIQSVPGRDMWNAIDPNVILDDQQKPWLTFGSFWNGIKLVRLAADLKTLAQPEEWHTISKRYRTFELKDSNPGDGAVEAPFIFKKNGYYYLFVSFDFCCRGKESTYKVVVGRSKTVEGPYIDKTGKSMNEGGGSIVVQGGEQWAGVGHNSVYTFDGNDYLFYHAYDLSDNGKPKLQVRRLEWTNDGWPVAVEGQ